MSAVPGFFFWTISGSTQKPRLQPRGGSFPQKESQLPGLKPMRFRPNRGLLSAPERSVSFSGEGAAAGGCASHGPGRATLQVGNPFGFWGHLAAVVKPMGSHFGVGAMCTTHFLEPM